MRSGSVNPNEERRRVALPRSSFEPLRGSAWPRLFRQGDKDRLALRGSLSHTGVGDRHFHALDGVFSRNVWDSRPKPRVRARDLRLRRSLVAPQLITNPARLGPFVRNSRFIVLVNQFANAVGAGRQRITRASRRTRCPRSWVADMPITHAQIHRVRVLFCRVRYPRGVLVAPLAVRRRVSSTMRAMEPD